MHMETVIFDFMKSTPSLTKSLLESFIEGISECNYPVHRINLSSTNVLDCKACTEDIWFDPNSGCKCDDELANLYPILKKCQLLVFAIDLEYKNLLKELSKVIDRLEPLFNISFNGDTRFDRKKVLALIFFRSNGSLSIQVSNLLDEFASFYNYEYLGHIYRGQTHLVDLLPESIFKSLGFDLDYHKLAIELVKNNTLNEDLINRIQRNLTPEDSVLREIFSAYRLI